MHRKLVLFCKRVLPMNLMNIVQCSECRLQAKEPKTETQKKTNQKPEPRNHPLIFQSLRKEREGGPKTLCVQIYKNYPLPSSLRQRRAEIQCNHVFGVAKHVTHIHHILCHASFCTTASGSVRTVSQTKHNTQHDMDANTHEKQKRFCRPSLQKQAF